MLYCEQTKSENHWRRSMNYCLVCHTVSAATRYKRKPPAPLMEAYRESGGVTLLILNLGSGGASRFGRLIPGTLGGPQSRTGRFGKETNLSSLPGIKPRFLCCPARRLACGLATQFRLHLLRGVLSRNTGGNCAL